MNRSRWRLAALSVFLLIAPIACLKTGYLESVEIDEAPDLEPGRPATVQRVAAEIDLLEKHIEWYGSVVPKRPDVWGQARLMAHRYEYEQQMAERLDKFSSTINARITRVDQALLATAFALGIGSAAPKAEARTATNVSVANATSLTADASKTPPAPDKPAVAATIAGATSLEPTIDLNQRSRYLNHLHELRRINEGDDNADTPGYALNLVRIPVSVLTGAHTDKGYGAELTVTAAVPYNDTLLPTTFRNMVIRDLVDLFTLPIAQFIGAEKVDELVELIRSTDDDETEAYLPPAMTTDTPTKQVWRSPRHTKMETMINRFAMTKRSTTQAPQRFAGMLGANAVNVPSRSRVSQLPLPPSQMIEVFGVENAARIVAAIYRSIRSHVLNDRSPKGRSPFHLDIQGALTDELEAAYKFLNADPTQTLWANCSEVLASAIHRRDEQTVRMIRDEFDNQIDRLTPPWQEIIEVPTSWLGPRKKGVWRYASNSVSACLAWTIVVQSALLERRLHQDILATMAAKSMAVPGDGMHCHYHGPNPPAEARKVFHDYVLARWPIYVFALDPVTDEQNIGDKYTEVREAQLAVAVAFAAGQINGAAAMNYLRKLTRDMETIGLNRTVVGFAHGERTFGWRFYPRFQTPPFQSTLATVSSLISPPDDKKQMNREARLENGQRECVAIMVMPSFVPYVDFEFSSHWFQLNSPKIRKGTATNAMRLSRRVQALRAAAPHCSDVAMYRDGDIALLINRLEQLSARLPYSQQRVNVPYENTSGGFELFNTGITDLGPELHGWYGAPGIDQDGNTTLFLVGDNFSVHQTRVIAGGLHVTAQPTINITVQPKGAGVEIIKADYVQNPFVELLSRQVLRITIPAKTLHYLNSQSMNRFIDVHVATPYGVSRSLSIPLYGDIRRERGNSQEPSPPPKPIEPMPKAPMVKAPPNENSIVRDVRWNPVKETPAGK